MEKVDEEQVAGEHDVARVGVLVERDRKTRVEPDTPTD